MEANECSSEAVPSGSQLGHSRLRTSEGARSSQIPPGRWWKWQGGSQNGDGGKRAQQSCSSAVTASWVLIEFWRTWHFLITCHCRWCLFYIFKSCIFFYPKGICQFCLFALFPSFYISFLFILAQIIYPHSPSILHPCSMVCTMGIFFFCSPLDSIWMISPPGLQVFFIARVLPLFQVNTQQMPGRLGNIKSISNCSTAVKDEAAVKESFSSGGAAGLLPTAAPNLFW